MNIPYLVFTNFTTPSVFDRKVDVKHHISRQEVFLSFNSNLCASISVADMELTCITCRVAFSSSDIQRDHYRSEWHRYNLKRKVAELAPIPIAEFEKRQQGKLTSQCHCTICGIVSSDEKAFIIHQQSKNHQENLKKLQTEETTGTHAPFQPELFTDDDANGIYCTVCKKRFNTHNAFENHMNSKKHKEAAKDTGDDSISVGVASKPVIKGTEKVSESMDLSDEENDDDVETDSEVEEVDSDEWDEFEDENNPIYKNDCIFCKHHSGSLYKNLKHMTVVHSFFLPDTKYLVDMRGLLMYLGAKVAEGFMCLWCNAAFDSLEAVRNHMIDKGHCMMLHEGDAVLEYEDYYDYSSSYKDGGNPDEEVDVEELDGSGYTMKLPSGTTIGHRSLTIYYKQNVQPHRALVLAGAKRKELKPAFRALAVTEIQRKQEARKKRDIKILHLIQNRHYQRLGVKANKFQPHFRRQVMF